MGNLILVRPTDLYEEQVMSYREEMLGLILPVCREFGEKQVLLTCDKDNEASRRTIISNYGVLENEVEDTVGLGQCGVIQRYWITL